jgi:hypothetical protein
MTIPTRLNQVLVFATLCLAACQGQHATLAALPQEPARTAIFTPSPSVTRTSDTPPSRDAPLRVITLADNDDTIALTIGEGFGLQLGPSPGSPWLIRVGDPSMLVPPVHQFGPEGRRVFFKPLKSGSTRIEANSHGICEHPGPCPEVFVKFALNILVQAR